VTIDIKNLTGLEKPLVKLVEVCAEGVGAIARPWLIKREAKALAEAQSSLVDAGLELTEVQLGSLKAQVAARVEYQEAKRQKNLQAVAQEARASLPPLVDEGPVDPDWIARFFSHAQDVSQSDMQVLWGRLLSGEVAKPGTFSLRTLDLVRNLSINEAQLFSNLSKFVFVDGWFINPFPGEPAANPDVLVGGTKEDDFEAFYEEHGLPAGSLKILREAGLVGLDPSDGLASVTFSAAKGTVVVGLASGEVRFSHPSLQRWDLRFDGDELTAAGREILAVTKPEKQPELLQQLTRVAVRLGLTPV
jgi:hypothetical protein